MNTPSLTHPRLVCRLVRQWCTLVANANSRHVAACPDCQAYFAAHASLETGLRREAVLLARPAPAASDQLENRILRAVRNSTPAAPEPRALPWRGAWAMAAAVAVVIGAGVFYREAAAEKSVTQAGVAALSETVESVSRELVDSVIPTAGALVADNPLQQEFDSIFGDAQAALGFLALNFLPGAGSTAATAPARPI